MASLIIKLNPERSVRLEKSVTSLGRGLQNDVRLNDPSVKDRHAHILKDRSGFRIFATDGAKLLINGKKKSEAALQEGDEVSLGQVKLLYKAVDEPVAKAVSTVESSAPAPEVDSTESTITSSVPLEALKLLYRFSAEINAGPNLEMLQRTLVDSVIGLAKADAGFLIVLDDNDQLRIDVARNGAGQDLPEEEKRLSDSIVRDVLRNREPLLLSDALEDSSFSDSRSVVNYRLRSVIAVPIVLGDELLGVLYLGCDRKTSAFSSEYLNILAVFAAQAGLLVKNAMQVDSLRQDNEALKEELDSRTFGEIVGGSGSMQEVFKAISKLAPTDISVLIVGETGTGKELIAKEIHRRSTRKDGPFVAINTSAIPQNLLEAELFGHKKGAFTGALADRRGKFAQADGGTLFLDEIGDMPLSLQAKLLRVLQERVVEKVGSNDAEPIDIRVIAATNRDLDKMQRDETFRPDLFFRLNEVQVSLPALRDRGDDILLLASYFLTKYNQQMSRRLKRFTSRAEAALKRFTWRGNVRELEARVKKAVVMSEGPDIDLADLALEESQMSRVLPLKEAKEAYAAKYVREILALNNGNRSKTARDLGVNPRTVYNYLEVKRSV